MKKDNQKKIVSLQKYIERMKNQLTNIPERHKHRIEQYKAFILRDIAKTEKAIENLRLT